MTVSRSIKRGTARAAAWVAGALLAAAAGSAAAAYPDRPITLLVTYPPGGTLDAVARVLAPKLQAALGQNVIVENRGGAGGMIGGAYVAKSAPDGYTVMIDASNYAQNPALHSHMLFDTINDFAPVSLLLRVPNVLVVTPSYQVKTVADLIKLAKPADGPRVYFASSGPGSAQHLAGELFNMLAHTHLVHVAYKGGGPAMIDVMAGQVPIMFASLGSAAAHIKAGKLRAVAVGGSTRSPIMPDLPTIAESGVPGYESYEWNGVFVPKGTPAPIIDKLSKTLAQVLKDPQVKQQLDSIGAEVIGSTPAELDTFRRAEIAKWKKVATQADLKLD
jgi:tripartite-type tricarboxylate transporter receptor subunit TctC